MGKNTIKSIGTPLTFCKLKYTSFEGGFLAVFMKFYLKLLAWNNQILSYRYLKGHFRNEMVANTLVRLSIPFNW